MTLSDQAALVIVDVQQAIDHPRYAGRNNPELLPNLERILYRWRRLGRPVYLVADDSPDPESPWRPGQPGNEFKQEIAPIAGETVIRKTAGDAFEGTAFEARLREAGHGPLVVGGFQTDQCVAATVRGALDRGFEVYVLADGTSTLSEEEHERALADLATASARVVSLEQVL